MRRYFVYYDILQKTGEIIYCGQGNDQRSSVIRKKKHVRNQLYNSYVKNNEVIRKRFEVQDLETALELEAYLIDVCHTWVDDPFHGEYACNIVQNGLEGFRQHSSISRQHMSNSRRGKKQSPEHIRNNAQARIGLKRTIEQRTKMSAWQYRPVNKYDKVTGKFITTYPSIMSAAIESEKSIGSGISTCCAGKRKYAGGFIWKYADECDGENDIIPFEIKKRQMPLRSLEFRKKLSIANSKPVYQINYITKQKLNSYTSALEASKKLNINHSNIVGCCNKKRQSAGGFIWRYVDDDEFISEQRENV